MVHPERDGGRIAHNLVSRNILDFIELSDEFHWQKLKYPIQNSLINPLSK